MGASRGLAATLAWLALWLGLWAGPAAAAGPVADPAYYPEGPLWHQGALFYTEMTRDRVSRWDGRRSSLFWTQAGCGPTSVAPLSRDRLLVLCHLSGELVVLDAAGKLLERIRRDATGRRLERPNDSTSDGHGGAYFTDAGEFWIEAPATGRVYHLSAEGALSELVGHLRYANGVTLSADGARLYVSEHLARRVWSFPVAADDSLGEGRVFFDLSQVAEPPRFSDEYSGPDGLELDARGDLFICEYGAGRLLEVSPEGHLLRILQVPLPYVTNAAFDEEHRRLFITGAWTNREPPNLGQVLTLPSPGP